MKLNIPNIISLLRVAISPVFLLFLLSQDKIIVQIACILFLFGAITDYFDGWYARKFNKVTSLGMFVDPLADKILTSAAFIGFVVLGIVDLWMVLIIVMRDMFTTILRVYADSIDKPLKTSYRAQWKTFVQMLFIAYLLLLIFLKNSSYTTIHRDMINNLLYSDITYYSMLFLTIFTLWTAVEYIVQNRETVGQFLYDNVRKNYL